MNSSYRDFVVTRTPMRVSFAGGGTDLEAYYKHDYGCVVSTSINKYIYVTVKKHGQLFKENYRLNYSETENVDHLDQIQNMIARECLKLVPVEPPLYISTVADLPAHSGLGSSSTFAVGLLHALHALRGESVSQAQLAEEACYIEINALERPIGKQDQYAAALGGMNYLKFNSTGRVEIEPLHLDNNELKQLFEHSLMFWTNIQRDAGSILKHQKQNTQKKLSDLDQLRGHAEELRVITLNNFSVERFANLLLKGWKVKRQLTTAISSDQVNDWYNQAMESGALGGKLCGAGGGGFLLFLVPPQKQSDVISKLSELDLVRIQPDFQGSKVLYSEFGDKI